MKILHLTPTLPWPADSGGKIGIWNLMRADSREHQVGLLSFCESDPSAEVLDRLGSLCWEAEVVRRPRGLDGVVGGARSLLTQSAMNLAKYRWPVFSEALADFVERWHPDVVVAHHLHMAPYLGDINGPVRILREHNIDSELMFRYAESLRNPAMAAFARRQGEQIRDTEKKLPRTVDHALVISKDDERLLHGIVPELPATVVPAPLDAADYAPAAAPPPMADPLIVIAGSLAFRPTGEGVLSFAEHAWPRVLKKLPKARLRIIGRAPETLVRRLRKAAPTAEITGHVPRLEEHLDGAAAFIVPLEVGSGIRIRILEAMAWSLPVVSTTIGCEGLEVEDGRQLLVADGPEEMANAIHRLVREPVVAQTLRREGRRLVEKRFSLEAVEAVTGRLYRRLAPDPVDSATG